MKIKYYDKNKGMWVLTGASNASELELTNPAYVDSPDETVSVDDGFTRVHNRIDRMDKNLAWIYINGAKGGGGGGGTNLVTITVEVVGDDVLTKSPSDTVILTYNFTSVWASDNYPTGNGVARYTVNNTLVYTQTIRQGETSFDITKYLKSGNNTVNINVTDTEGNNRNIVYNINVVALSLTSTFDYKVPYTGSIPFRFTPVGAITKTVHFVIDNVEVGNLVTDVSNRQITYNLPQQTHGSHTLRVYMTAEVSGVTVTSNSLFFALICVVAGNNTPIIASSFQDGTYGQYEVANIEYIVYDPIASLTTITLSANGTVLNILNVDRNSHMWNYRFTETGSVVLTITCKTVTRTFTFNVEESEVNVDPVTDDLVLYLTSNGRSNNESNPSVWEYNNIHCTLTDFNFVNNGWIINNGETVLRVSGEARVTIPYKLFSTDFKSLGKTIEIEFSTTSISNYDAVIMSCIYNNIGLSIKTQEVSFGSELSSISAKFKEDEKVRISFVIDKSSEDRLIYIYINGIISGMVQYPSNDSFTQLAPVDITLGSAECTLDIYNIRVYDNNLTKYQILDNYIADLNTLDEKLAIYNDNQVYDEYGDIDYEKVVAQVPCMTITGSLPAFKGDIKQVNIEFQNQQDPSKSFTLREAQIDVQGTSSQYYPRKNYTFKPTYDFTYPDGSTSPSYVLKTGDLAAKLFCIKADYMESSGSHNTGLAKLVNNTLKAVGYLTPPQIINQNIRTTVDGFPIVVFMRNSIDDIRQFYGKYNFNHDKEAEEVYGFTNPLVHESWEFLNNTSDNVLFKTADFTSVDGNGSPIWLSDFSARYPVGYLYDTNLKVVCQWVASTRNDINKFRQEVSQHFNLNNIVAYYVITEVFGMVDQRAKNQFLTSWGRENDSDEYIWYFIIYDSDTCLGLNNEGVNQFNYNIEYHDLSGTSNVWNGEQSVLWNNLENTYASNIQALYNTLRINNLLSYEKAIEIFNVEQSDQWNESIYNIDSQFKYIDPLIDDNNATYLYACQGSREEHRKWWLYNRFKYLDSKYGVGDFLEDFVTMRIYTPTQWSTIQPNADFRITPYADQYIQIKYGSYIAKVRGYRNVISIINAPDIQFNDTETIIYGASRLSSLGDLSAKYPGTVDVSQAVKLKELIIGNQASGYVNTNMRTLSIGNNDLLRKLDVSNCPNLINPLDVTGCDNLREIYAKGSGITSVLLSEAGVLETLWLPGTISNLTLKNQILLNNQGFSIEGYSNISTIVLENNIKLDQMEILASVTASSSVLQKVRCTGINTTRNNLDLLVTLMNYTGIDDTGNNTDNPWLQGTYTATYGAQQILDQVRSAYPLLTINVTSIVQLPETTFVFNTGTTTTTVNFASNLNYTRLSRNSFKVLAETGTVIQYTATAENHQTMTGSYTVTVTRTQTYTLIYNPIRTLIIKVYNTTTPIENAEISLSTQPTKYYTDQTGTVSFREAGPAQVTIKKSSYADVVITLPNSTTDTTQNIVMYGEIPYTVYTKFAYSYSPTDTTRNLIPGVTVTIGDRVQVSNQYGEANFMIPPGTYQMTAHIGDYTTSPVAITTSISANVTSVVVTCNPMYFKPTENGNIQLLCRYTYVDYSTGGSANLVINSTSSFTIDWGDGTQTAGSSGKYAYTHTADNGTFNLTEIINGEGITEIVMTTLVAFYSWGNNTTGILIRPWGKAQFAYMSNDAFKNGADKVTALTDLFSNGSGTISSTNTGLVIESNAFEPLTSVTSLEGMFQSSSLKVFDQYSDYNDLETILSSFANSATTAAYIFYVTPNIDFNKPLFKNFVNLTNIAYGLAYSSSNANTIPLGPVHEDFFMGCNKLVNLSYLFRYREFTNILSNNLFRDLPTSTINFVGMFNGCTGIFPFSDNFLTGKTVTIDFMFYNAIFDYGWMDVFDNCTIDYVQSAFYGSNINFIPPNLIKNMSSEVDTINNMFRSTLVSEIPSNIFAGKSSITIATYAFSDCTNLIDINSESLVGLTGCYNYNYTFQNTGITEIPDNFFPAMSENHDMSYSYCFRNTKITRVPSGVFKYGNSRTLIYCFSECTELVEVEDNFINNNSYIVSANNVFNNCSKLKKAYMSHISIWRLSSNMFSGCTALESICINLPTPPTMNTNAIGDPNTTFIIYVPDASVNAYKTATNWSNYASRIKGISELPE